MGLGNTPRRLMVLSLEARKSFAFGLRVLNAEDKLPVDLTGSTFRLTVAQPKRKGGAVVLTTTATILDPLLGLAQFPLQASDLDLAAGEYPFAVTWVSASGYSTLIMKGTIDLVENTDTASTASTYSGVNPSTSLAAYVEFGAETVVTVERFDGRVLTVLEGHATATTGVHGVVGSVVGTTDAQALTNKNLSDPTNVFPASLATDAEVSTAVANHDADTSSHGVTGAVVGTTDAQTLTNKTLTAPTINDPVVALGGKVVREVVVDNLAPAHAEGRIWRDADDTWGRTYISDGTTWRCIGIDVLPEALCTKTGVQSLPTSAHTTVNWGAANPNVGSMWSGAGGTLTVPIAGIYAINGQVQLAGSATGIDNVSIWINGAMAQSNGGGDYINNEGNQKAVSLVRNLAANATIELKAYQNSGGPLDIEPGVAPYTSLDVILVRPL